VSVHLALRALVPVVTPQAAAIAIRMLDRSQQFQQFSRHWSARPKVPALLPCSTMPGQW
jgi:hypothetical protein